MVEQTHEETSYVSSITENSGAATAGKMFLRLVRAAQPISRIEIANRLGVNRSTVTEIAKPLINHGRVVETGLSDESGSRSLGRPRIGLTFADGAEMFAGLHIGVRGSQIGLSNLNGEILAEENLPTPNDAREAMRLFKNSLEKLCQKFPERVLSVVGVSVPGVTDARRGILIFAPHLGWRQVEIAGELQNIKGSRQEENPRVIVENDATAAAIYEARLRLKKTTGGVLKDFILVRSGTGIGVGMVINGEVYRGAGRNRGIAGEFGHMTIMAGGKPCVCGNRGCWERYASAAAAASLYTGDRMQLGASAPPRYVEIVNRAEAGEIRAQKTLEKIGEYLGVGIANVITGLGVANVTLSGRIVAGWKFLREPLREAVGQSMAGRLSEWSVEAGEEKGAGLGGAFEIAAEEYLSYGFNHII